MKLLESFETVWGVKIDYIFFKIVYFQHNLEQISKDINIKKQSVHGWFVPLNDLQYVRFRQSNGRRFISIPFYAQSDPIINRKLTEYLKSVTPDVQYRSMYAELKI